MQIKSKENKRTQLISEGKFHFLVVLVILGLGLVELAALPASPVRSVYMMT